MARKAIVVKNLKKKKEVAARKAKNLPVKFPTRVYNRCDLCGKVRGYMRKTGTCRICFREKAAQGEIMGVKKSSW